MVHWKREWQITSVFLPREPHEQYEKAKSHDTEDVLPRLAGAQYATGKKWKNNSRKNEEKEPKRKQHPGVYVTGDGSKAQRTILHGEMTEVYENDSVSQYHPPPGPFYVHLYLLVSMITHLQEDLQIIISSLTPTQSTRQLILYRMIT